MEQTIGQKLKRQAILFLARHLPPCKMMVELFSEARERPLTMREKFVSKLHLLTCQACQRYVGQIEKMGEMVKPEEKEAEVNVKMSDEARERIRAAIAAATRQKN